MDTRPIPEQAIAMVMPAINEILKIAKRQHGHIVVIDPKKKPWECKFKEAIWHEESISDGKKWEYPYGDIARSKAEQGWREGQSNVITHMLAPATLRSGDTIYYGSVNYYGVVVAFSGVQPYFDMLISGLIAQTIHALSQHYIEKHKGAYPDEHFLP